MSIKKNAYLGIICSIALLFSSVVIFPSYASASSTAFSTSFENADTQVDYIDKVDWSTNVSGYTEGISPECAPRANEISHTGSTSLLYSGTDNSTSSSYVYFKVFSVSLSITPDSYLDYYIYPQNDNGRYVGVDFHCTDGTTLRDSGALDQNGYSIHPAAGHGGNIPINAWSLIRSNVGLKLAGKTVDMIWIAYDRAAGTGQFRGYIDDISVTSSEGVPLSGRTLFETGAENGTIQPYWSNTLDMSQNVSGFLSGINPECGTRIGEFAHSGVASIMYAGTDNSASGSFAYFKVFNVKMPIQSDTYLDYYIYPQNDNGRYAGIDFHCTDGTTLRDSSAVDQNGFRMHPSAGHGGNIPINSWSLIRSNVGAALAGKTVDKIWIAYDRSESTGQFRGYIDDIRVYNTSEAPIAPQPRTTQLVTPTYATNDSVVADYNVLNYGATNDGSADSTAAIQQALDDCYNAGGGTVWMPAGKYLISDTLYVRSFVDLRGDWRDPDSGSGSYGTELDFNLPSGAEGKTGIQIGGSAGVIGLTTYYINQSAANPVPYNYTFEIPAEAWTSPNTSPDENFQTTSIINCTMINSYKGIGVSTMPNDAGLADAGGTVNECPTIRNVKGTVLKTGMTIMNGSDVGVVTNINFDNSYWANAGTAYNAPSLSALNSYTRANATAYILGNIEWYQLYNIKCSQFDTGIHVVAGTRAANSNTISNATIINTNTGVLIDQDSLDWALGTSFMRATITGSNYSVQNLCTQKNPTDCYAQFYDCTLNGATYGRVKYNVEYSTPAKTITMPGPSGVTPTSYHARPATKTTRQVLYNVALAPYDAPCRAPQSGLPTVDATPAIQSALNDAGAAGGGVVYLPAGWYHLSGNLSVPANVELRGCLSAPTRDEPTRSAGTVLMGYGSRDIANPESATALVTLNGNNAGIKGIRFFYPENNPNGGIKPYPYTIRGNGSDIYIENVNFANSYYGVDFKTNRCDRHSIVRVMGCCLAKCFVIGASTEGWFEENLMNGNAAVRQGYNVAGWPWEPSEPSAQYTYVITPYTNKGTFAGIDNVSNEHIVNNFEYGYNNFLVFSGSVAGGEIINCGTDFCIGTGILNNSNVTINAYNYEHCTGQTSYGNVNVYGYMRK